MFIRDAFKKVGFSFYLNVGDGLKKKIFFLFPYIYFFVYYNFIAIKVVSIKHYPALHPIIKTFISLWDCLLLFQQWANIAICACKTIALSSAYFRK